MNVDIRSSYGYACALKSPCSVSRKANVNASKTWSVPNQTYFEPSGRTFVPKSPNRRRRLFAPSAPTTRSASGSSSTSTPNSSVTPSSRHRSCRISSSRLRAIAENEWPRDDSSRPWKRMAMRSQRANVSVISRCVSGSASLSAPSVSSLKTTPKPNVASGGFRSRTRTSTPAVELAQQDREVEARRPAADDLDVHASASWSRSSSSISATVGKRTSSSHPASS